MTGPVPTFASSGVAAGDSGAAKSVQTHDLVPDLGLRARGAKLRDRVPGPVVDFFYGIGSRYSYLASTRLAGLQAETGARIVWHPLSSSDLMARRGQNPFAGVPPSGQYDWAYRRRDALAWAAYYGVPFRDPHGRLTLDSRLLALASVAARRLGRVEAYSHALFRAVFVDDLARVDRAACIERAVEVGFGAADFERALDAPETAAESTAIVNDAIDKGVFGVPTFVLGDRLFWGNDRLILLRHALVSHQGTGAPS